MKIFLRKIFNRKPLIRKPKLSRIQRRTIGEYENNILDIWSSKVKLSVLKPNFGKKCETNSDEKKLN
jgi:hypothetical protein